MAQISDDDGTAKRATSSSISEQELARFERLAAAWRDPSGPMRTLHIINPLRARWIADTVAAHHPARGLAGLATLDIGCAAGLLSEALCDQGAVVTGIDPVERSIRIAQRHAEQDGRSIAYHIATPEELVGQEASFDVVCALEVVEHVTDRPAFFRALASLLAPGGLLFVTTINRNWRSWLLAIAVAEKMLGAVPRGTHRWDWFVTPEEADDWLAAEGLRRTDLRGMRYWPILHKAYWTRDLSVNWAAAWCKPGTAVDEGI